MEGHRGGLFSGGEGRGGRGATPAQSDSATWRTVSPAGSTERSRLCPHLLTYKRRTHQGTQQQRGFSFGG